LGCERGDARETRSNSIEKSLEEQRSGEPIVYIDDPRRVDLDAGLAGARAELRHDLAHVVVEVEADDALEIGEQLQVALTGMTGRTFRTSIIARRSTSTGS